MRLTTVLSRLVLPKSNFHCKKIFCSKVFWLKFKTFLECSSLLLHTNKFFLHIFRLLFLTYRGCVVTLRPPPYFYMSKTFYWRKELIKADLSNTLNMLANSIENVLETLQKKFYLQKYYHPGRNYNSIWHHLVEKFLFWAFWEKLIS